MQIPLVLVLLQAVPRVSGADALLPSPAAVLADGKRAFDKWAATTPVDNCGWTGGTFLLGSIEYYKATAAADASDAAVLEYATNWAATYDYQICGGIDQYHESDPAADVSTNTDVSSAGTCASVQNAVFDRGTNLPGGDNAQTPAQCCAACRANAKCKSWNVHGRCFLHPEVGRVIHEKGSVAGVPSGKLPPLPPPSPPSPPHSQQHNANNQLCGATYVELFKLTGKKNSTMLADTAVVIEAEIAEGAASDGLWSWVDAIHMAMQTFARMGNVTGNVKYFEKQYANFNASVLAKAVPHSKTYQFWNASDFLFYRDDRYLGTQIYWSRGNGWAISALVAALEWGITSDPHYKVYLGIFKQHAAKLKSIQYADGAWRSSLLNVTADGGACSWSSGKGIPCDPVPETTGTANFCYALAWGINNGILPSGTFLPVVAKAWSWLSQSALHDDGLVGYCQPGGAAPENNFASNSTNNFCVGQFLLASSQVSRLAANARVAQQ